MKVLSIFFFTFCLFLFKSTSIEAKVVYHNYQLQGTQTSKTITKKDRKNLFKQLRHYKKETRKNKRAQFYMSDTLAWTGLGLFIICGLIALLPLGIISSLAGILSGVGLIIIILWAIFKLMN